MRYLCITMVVLFLLVNCKDRADTEQAVATDNTSLKTGELPEIMNVNPRARELLNAWPEFLDLENSMPSVYRVANREELRLLLDEIIEKEKAVADSVYPTGFDKPQVYSRQKVFKTYLLKAKAMLEYRTDPTEATVEMLNAYNALRREFDVLVNNPLDTNLISDD